MYNVLEGSIYGVITHEYRVVYITVVFLILYVVDVYLLCPLYRILIVDILRVLWSTIRENTQEGNHTNVMFLV